MGLRDLLRHRDVPRQAVAPAPVDDVVTGREEREVGHHRLVGPPAGGRLVAVHLAAAQPSVRDHLLVARHGDADVHERLVPGVVVRREPPRRHVRLVHGHDLVPVGEPVPLALIGDRAGVAGVPDLDEEALAVGDGDSRGDPQLVRVRLREPRLDAVDGHLADRQQEVEVEPREALGGLHREPRRAGQALPAELVGVVDLVADHVDAAVAVEREVRVADARRSRRRRGPGRGRQPEHQGGDHEAGQAANRRTDGVRRGARHSRNLARRAGWGWAGGRRRCITPVSR